MKKFKILITFVLAAVMFGCSEDDSNSIESLQNAPAPANIAALFTITQDNTGTVTVLPTGEGVSQFEVNWGDGDEEATMINVGGTAEHIYSEGNFTVTVTGISISGKRTSVTYPVTVSFLAPENVDAIVTPIPGNSMGINVSATAELETFFEVIFGEDPSAEPVQFNQGQTITHVYNTPGTYTVTVTAYSGGAATTVVTETVTVTNPLLLPITFESSTLNYAFGDFGNATTSVADNPDPSGINTSAKVGKQVKNAGAETWAGTVITLDAPIDFSTMNHFKVKVWSPIAGAIVKLKLENLTDGNISHEVDQVTTVANAWETLEYDFSGINTSQSYSKIVLFFNFNVNGTGETYYFDDIQQAAGVAALPVTFEDDTVYTITGFEGADGAEVANPHITGINTSATVGQVIKNTGSQAWAGIIMPLPAPIDFSNMQKIKIKVWSPQANIPVLLKFEQAGNPSVSTELTVNTTVANQWEELTYDFTGINNANNYQNFVLIFDMGTAGTGATYYFDDVKLSN